MSIRGQHLANWIGLATFFIFGLSFFPFAWFLPPLSPNLTPAEVVAVFKHNPFGIRFGMILMMYSASMNCMLVAVLAVQLRRIETVNPIWTYGQIVAGSTQCMIVTIGAVLMSAAAFRPDRPPEITFALFDLAWFFIVMPGTTAIAWNFTIGCAIASDKGPNPVFPRWLAYFNWWAAVIYTPGALVTYFKTGPFAWDGLFAFWIPAVIFGAWYVTMFVQVRKAINQQA